MDVREALPVRRSQPELDVLTQLFYEDSSQLGEFSPAAFGSLPAPYGALLNHDEHMTVTVERFHGCPVEVEVLDRQSTPTHYSRKILLRRSTDGVVVQFGLVRLTKSALSPAVQAEIESERTPLGRVLIENGVMRNVLLVSLWKVEPGAELQSLFGIGPEATCYGRSAFIYCDGLPGVELLEIVTPASAAA